MSRLKDILELGRPVNSVMVGFAVVVGAAVTSPNEVYTIPVMLGFLTGFLISSFSMTVNDYYDVEVDKINSPHRPLPSGLVTMKEAKWFAISLLLVGLFPSILISPMHFIIAIFFAFIAWLYNYWGKKHGIIGNILVATSISIPYVFGGLSVGTGNDYLIFYLSLITFVAATGREIVKGMTDVEGDKIREVWSVARSIGVEKAAYIGSIFFIAAVILSLLPLISSTTGIVYGVLITIPDSIFIYSAVTMIRDGTSKNAFKIKKIALFGMLAGLIAFIFGGVYRG